MRELFCCQSVVERCDMSFYKARAGIWVGKILKRFLIVIRWRENLSSGEKRAGWADLVGMPLGSTFYSKEPIQHSAKIRVHFPFWTVYDGYLERIDTIALVVKIIHQIHGGGWCCIRWWRKKGMSTKKLENTFCCANSALKSHTKRWHFPKLDVRDVYHACHDTCTHRDRKTMMNAWSRLEMDKVINKSHCWPVQDASTKTSAHLILELKIGMTFMPMQ